MAEGILPAFAHARAELLVPGAEVIPCGGSIRAALVADGDISGMTTVATVNGFDLSGFNRLSPHKWALHRVPGDLAFLSEEADVFTYDLTGDTPFYGRTTCALEVKKSGRAVGVIQWIKIALDADVTFENHPLKSYGASGWQPLFYPLFKPVEVHEGETFTFGAEYHTDQLYIDLPENA